MEENVNIKVEKKKRSIVPALFIIIVILLLVLGILLYDKIDTNDEGTISNEQGNKQENVESNVNNEENVTNTENTEKEQQNNQVNNDAIAEAYKKIEAEYWASKKENSLLKVINGEIIYSVSVGNEQKINFEYGKVKCADFGLGNGIPSNIIVVNESGEVYNIEFNGGVDSSDNVDQSKFTTIKIEFDEKVIDFSRSGSSCAVPYSGPYYLTESGKLITEEGKTYDEINRNHVDCIGSLGRTVYINKDNTLETLRNYNSNEYIDIVDGNGNKVKAKYVFYEGSSNEYFYVVDENKKLLSFSEETLMVASEYYYAKEKIVNTLEYDETNRKIKITFTDGTNITIDNVYSCKELDYKKID